MRTDTAFECRAVFSFKDSQAGVEQLAFRHDDDIEPWRYLVSTKHLSYQSFGSVSDNGAAESFGGRNAQASNRAAVGQNK